MTHKTITLSVSIPASYSYMATQPWGEIMLFMERPEIVKDPNDGGNYWGFQKTELSLVNCVGTDITHAGWENSLKKI